MSKWDEYQNFSTAAKKAGGVPSLIHTIEKKAVEAAAPGIFAKGLAAGATAAVAGVAVGRRYMAKRRADAKKQLIAGANAVGAESDEEHDEDADTEAGPRDRP